MLYNFPERRIQKRIPDEVCPYPQNTESRTPRHALVLLWIRGPQNQQFYCLPLLSVNLSHKFRFDFIIYNFLVLQNSRCTSLDKCLPIILCYFIFVIWTLLVFVKYLGWRVIWLRGGQYWQYKNSRWGWTSNARHFNLYY